MRNPEKTNECPNTRSSPQHERFVDGVSELEGVVTDGQVVLQSERLQHDAVSYRESQTQVVAGVTLKGKNKSFEAFRSFPPQELPQTC